VPYDDAARVASHIPDELFKGLRYVGTRLGRGLDVGSIPFLRASLALLLGDFALLLLEEDQVLVSVHRGGRASVRARKAYLNQIGLVGHENQWHALFQLIFLDLLDQLVKVAQIIERGLVDDAVHHQEAVAVFDPLSAEHLHILSSCAAAAMSKRANASRLPPGLSSSRENTHLLAGGIKNV